MNVGIVGQGYVGLTIAVAAAKSGCQVVGLDKNKDLVAELNRGNSHIEGISNDDISRIIESKHYRATFLPNELVNSDVIVIAVPTPLSEVGEPDLNLLEKAARELSPVLRKRTLIISESTSFPGTLRRVIKPLIDEFGEFDHLYAVSPERVDPGNEYFNSKNTPRVVGGISEEARDKAVEFYSLFCDDVISVSSPEIAEAAKLLENSFRFINIGFINEFARIMNAMNVSVEEVIDAAATKPYGFMKFTPTVGIGGHCIPVDPIYLQRSASEVGEDSKYIGLSERVNNDTPAYVATLLERKVGSLKGKRILIFGVSYKPDVADTRETSAIKFLKELRKREAIVFWHDPLVRTWNGESSAAVAGNYDFGFVLNEHSNMDFTDWNDKPIYTLMKSKNHPHWIALLSSEIR
jgi:UDP-N-acetyl-D-glucosamine dehydrogenase